MQSIHERRRHLAESTTPVRFRPQNFVTVAATPSPGGWLIDVDATHHLQVNSIAEAGDRVREYLDVLDTTAAHRTWTVVVSPHR